MEEVEKHFKCPYCFERISMLLDPSISDVQSYVEDCEVCCNPIQITFEVIEDKIKQFQAQKAYG
ncbi:hypothetical protein AZI86_05535 [Bdellovibrio bacteriovorus]|uniref:CPXCG motif-containing cysteine-rich protein n=1 Tax=Bdellovibrio bacteriovorus TaxID=959 RepID=A0A150WQ40_BDEBC|nr:CPXCG motif-containing cysteine-rich protein [Bdellovibrio bacteriovorus]KYG66508.1 hypothetical protein AZI86_05535 [Bdellovibrio bacteriovorus]